MHTFTAAAPILPMVTFRRVAVVLSALVIVLATYLGFPSNPPDDDGQNCQSGPALIAQPITSDYLPLCVPNSIMEAEHTVIAPGNSLWGNLSIGREAHFAGGVLYPHPATEGCAPRPP